MSVQVQTSVVVPRVSRGDLEFLPAALEILQTPPSPVSVALQGSIVLLVLTALAWSCVGRVDILAVAQGKVQPVGRTKTVQTVETSRVERIDVANGTRVRAGDPLVELDARAPLADALAATSSLWDARAEVTRRTAALQAAASRAPAPSLRVAWPADMPGEFADREQRVLDGDLARLDSEVAGLRAQADEKTSEASRLTDMIAAQQVLVDALQERVTMRSTLVAAKAMAKANLIDARESLGTQMTYLADLKGQLTAARNSVAAAARAVDTAFATFVADNAQKRADAARRADDSSDKLSRARITTERMLLRSPVDGIVQGLAVTSPGQVVTSGQDVLQVVPENAGFEVQCYLLNRDVGFVKDGMSAQVKVDAFPFTRYGTLEASVEQVATEAIPQPEADGREGNPTLPERSATYGGAERTQNLVFPVTASLKQASLDVDGTRVPLTSGMTVTVEIKTGTRRIIDYLLSPLAEIGSRAIRER